MQLTVTIGCEPELSAHVRIALGRCWCRATFNAGRVSGELPPEWARGRQALWAVCSHEDLAQAVVVAGQGTCPTSALRVWSKLMGPTTLLRPSALPFIPADDKAVGQEVEPGQPVTLQEAVSAVFERVAFVPPLPSCPLATGDETVARRGPYPSARAASGLQTLGA